MLKSKIIKGVYDLAFEVSPRVGMYLRNRTLPWGRPTLAYLEVPLADHCNLNCAGCMHYAPFAEKRFADMDALRRDFGRLAGLFRNIRQIRLMGGEPLLNPRTDEAVRIVRAAFPRSRVSVVTNGLRLLGKADDDLSRLLVAMRETRTAFDWTAYPPVAGRASEIEGLCRRAGVGLSISRTTEFMARIRLKGGSGVRRAFKWCRKRLYCPILDDGRVYTCAPARYAACYNKAAGTKIPVERGLDIHASSAKEIMYYLMCPSFACSHCEEGARFFPWKAGADPKDWQA